MPTTGIQKQIMTRARKIREKAGLTQADVARVLGCSANAYGHYETDIRQISVEDVFRLPAILNCRISDLLPDDVLSDYDLRRLRDPNLDAIIETWPNLPHRAQEILKSTLDNLVGMIQEGSQKKHRD